MPKININIEMPDTIQKEYKHRDLCEKVNDYMVVCESDSESEYHWKYLKALYKKLNSRNQVPEQYREMLGELQAFISKYSQADSGDDLADIEGTDIFKYKDEA